MFEKLKRKISGNNTEIKFLDFIPQEPVGGIMYKCDEKRLSEFKDSSPYLTDAFRQPNQVSKTLMVEFGKHPDLQTSWLYITPSPTCNCQMYSIGHLNDVYHATKNIDYMVDILKYIYLNYTRKRVIFLDIKKNFYDGWIKELEEMGIVSSFTETPYVSTNGSRMISFIVNLNSDKLTTNE